ncbi:MAG: Stk1 family PASTA domain-containing Ser/Thr kinase [Clostridia bacterium]|nr:Stk1 family PASTA domain-containing Ser/Thr kinase [Clostridia bacterium]
MDNYTGKRLDGRYEIQEVIGVGGMAVVYKAYDNIDDRTVAVKILKEEYLANEEFRRRFKNESKAIAVLSHPNIVKVFNVSYGDRLQYIVMEHVEGITLKEYIEQQGKLGIKETVHFTMQILRALQHAHDKGIVHRDIKPQNIMLLSNGNIKVTDFGIARFSYSDTKTMTDSAIGSVHYISPEQARGDTTDDRADIYSVGVVMYEMLTGQLPFQSDNSVSVALMQLQSDPKRPRELNGSIPVGLEQIVMHAMQKNTRDRYQSAAEMLLDIEEFKRNPTIRFQRDYFVDNDPTKFVPKKPSAVAPSQPPVSKPAQVQAPVITQPPYNEYEEEEEESRGRGGLIAIGVTIGLLVLAVFVFAFLYFFTDVFDKGEIVVPTFVGKNYVEEIKDNDEYNKLFKFEVEELANSAFSENGVVFDQDPKSGTKISGSNNVVKLLIVKNAQTSIIPNVLGYQYEQAKLTLENKGFKVNAIPMLSMVEEFGTVIKMDPEPETEVDTSQVITIYFASDEDLVTVPKIIGWDEESAKLLIESVPLTLDPEIKRENSDKPAGVVIDQTPAEGEKVMAKSRVTIVVSTGVPESSTAEIKLTLPNKGAAGQVQAYVNNELADTKTLLFDGTDYTFMVEGSGSEVPVKFYIDNKEYYSCTVDFTKTEPVVTNGVYSSSSTIDTPDARKAMPSVVGLSMAAAEAQLNAQGFYNIKYEYSTVFDPSQDGKVISQTPSASTNSGILGLTNTYPISEEITLVVGQKIGV